jgi:hypothetical protein
MSSWVLDASLVFLMVAAALMGIVLHRHLVGPTVTDGEYERWQRWIPEMQLAFFVSLSTGVWLAMRVALWAARGRHRQRA